jgi:hypothetical protein
MGVVELLLVRHGESAGNVAAARAAQDGAELIEVPSRDADVELSETGREQALGAGRGPPPAPGSPPARRDLVLHVRTRAADREAGDGGGGPGPQAAP